MHKNHEGYADPTAGIVISKVTRSEKNEQRRNGGAKMSQIYRGDIWKAEGANGKEMDVLVLATYDDDIGVEFEQLAYASSREEKENIIIDSITDALSIHPAFESIEDFVFDYHGDECIVSFTIKGYQWNEEILSISIPT